MNVPQTPLKTVPGPWQGQDAEALPPFLALEELEIGRFYLVLLQFPFVVDQISPERPYVKAAPQFPIDNMTTMQKNGVWRPSGVNPVTGSKLPGYARLCLVVGIDSDQALAQVMIITTKLPLLPHRWMAVDPALPAAGMPDKIVTVNPKESFHGRNSYLCFSHVFQVRLLQRNEPQPTLPPGGVHAKHFQHDKIACTNFRIVEQMHREHWSLRVTSGDDNTSDNGHGKENNGDNGHGNEDTGDNGHGNEDTGDNGHGNDGTGGNGHGNEDAGGNSRGNIDTGSNDQGSDDTGGNGHGSEDTGGYNASSQKRTGVASPEFPEKNLKVVDTVTDFDIIWGVEYAHEDQEPWWAKDIPPSPPRLLSDKARQEMREVLLLCECEDEPEEEEGEEEPRPPIIFDGSILPISSPIELSRPSVMPTALCT